MKKLLLCLIALSTLFSAQAQRTCATMDVHDRLTQTFEDYSLNRQAIENFTKQYKNNAGARLRSTAVNIPVVVHIVYSDSAGDISDAQVLSQIARLNTDYNKQNADTANIPAVWQSAAANVGISFCLAVRDPNGLPTTGIIRKRTSTTSWSTNDAVKYSAQGGDDAWPSSSYLNIWVCNLGGGLLGYSQFPGGPAATDGCVILNTGFGDQVGTVAAPYNLGRTVTHEVGHWLNLYHPFQGGCNGGDSCADTPPTAAATYGCSTFPLLGTGCSTTSPGIMFMDYMDYSDDACLYMFTNDQNARIQALFVPGGWRSSIVNSMGCVPVGGGPYALFSADKTNICAGQSVTFTNNSLDTPTVFQWSFPGGTPSSSTAQTPPSITYSTPGTYTVSLTVTKDTSSNTKTITNYITVVGTSPLPLAEGFEGASFPPTGWTIGNADNLTAWQQTDSAGGFGLSQNSTVFNSIYTTRAERGQRDYLYTPMLDFSGVTASKLAFDYAYSRNQRTRTGVTTNSQDTLWVKGSADCGNTWTTLWVLGDSLLATAPGFLTTHFVPTASQWVRDSSIDLSNVLGNPSVQFAFVHYNGRGNALYIDNVNISGTTSHVGINDVDVKMQIKVIPNPATDMCTLRFDMDQFRNVEVGMYDMLGKNLWSKDLGNVHAASEPVSLVGLAPGVYLIRVKAGERTFTTRVVKQ